MRSIKLLLFQFVIDHTIPSISASNTKCFIYDKLGNFSAIRECLSYGDILATAQLENNQNQNTKAFHVAL